jgi:eukaryotic-like serine/threonine-protein kinase
VTSPARDGMSTELIAERYELVELVGTGGMSSVYKAHDQLLERNVALKVLHPHYGEDDDYVERFRREARAVAQLSHPNIVTVIDRGADDGRQYIVFEYVDGENLKQLLGRTGPLPIRRAIELGLGIAEALAFAHEHGLVHRDVKPQNVLLTPEGEAKVTDFGIARSLDVERGVTQTGTVLGTSNYISPEQAGGKPVTPATDVYSLGVVLFELLTGDVPFPGENFVAVAMRHINDPVPDLRPLRPDAPLRLVAAVERALEKDPRRRFASMDEFAGELRSCLAELGSSDSERTFVAPSPARRAGGRRALPHRARRARRRPAWPWLVLLALVVAAGIVGVVLGLGSKESPSKESPSNAGGGSAGGGTALALTGVGTSDPAGDGEHDADVPKATDGDPRTYWYTQSYYNGDGSLGKAGVGIVVQAARMAAARSLTVSTDTPGYTAQILAGGSPSGAFVPDSASQTVNARTTFKLRGRGARYYVVWITNLGSYQSVHVNEVTARS